jgi:hypothetical protein
MSRKDPRRTLRVPLTDGDLAALRVQARRRDGREPISLADALRRIAAEAMAHGVPVPDPLPCDAPVVRRLPLQIPRSLRARLEAAGGDPALRIRACLTARIPREGS